MFILFSLKFSHMPFINSTSSAIEGCNPTWDDIFCATKICRRLSDRLTNKRNLTSPAVLLGDKCRLSSRTTAGNRAYWTSRSWGIDIVPLWWNVQKKEGGYDVPSTLKTLLLTEARCQATVSACFDSRLSLLFLVQEEISEPPLTTPGN